MGKALANKVSKVTRDLPRMRNLQVKSKTPHTYYLSRDNDDPKKAKIGGNATY